MTGFHFVVQEQNAGGLQAALTLARCPDGEFALGGNWVLRGLSTNGAWVRITHDAAIDIQGEGLRGTGRDGAAREYFIEWTNKQVFDTMRMTATVYCAQIS